MAQVVERYFREVEAASSSLVTPIKEKILESLIFKGFPVFFCIWELGFQSRIYHKAVSAGNVK